MKLKNKHITLDYCRDLNTVNVGLPHYFRGRFLGFSRFQSAIFQVFLRSHMSIFQVLSVIFLPKSASFHSRFKITQITNFHASLPFVMSFDTS